MQNNVIDIRTKGPLFNKDLRERLHSTVASSASSLTPDDAKVIVSQVEQVICTTIVQAGKLLAEKLASKVFKTFFQQQQTPR